MRRSFTAITVSRCFVTNFAEMFLTNREETPTCFCLKVDPVYLSLLNVVNFHLHVQYTPCPTACCRIALNPKIFLICQGRQIVGFMDIRTGKSLCVYLFGRKLFYKACFVMRLLESFCMACRPGWGSAVEWVA